MKQTLLIAGIAIGLMTTASSAQQQQYDPDKVAYEISKDATGLAEFLKAKAQEAEALRQRAAGLEARVKELEGKYEPKNEPKNP